MCFKECALIGTSVQVASGKCANVQMCKWQVCKGQIKEKALYVFLGVGQYSIISTQHPTICCSTEDFLHNI